MKQERIENENNRIVMEVLIPALLTILVGILIVGYNLYQLICGLNDPGMQVLGTLGVIYILMGVIGIRLSKDKVLNYVRTSIQKGEKILVLCLAYALWILSIVWVIWAVFMGIGNVLLAFGLSALAVVTLACSFLVFTDLGLRFLCKYSFDYKIGWEYFNTVNPREEYEKFLKYERYENSAEEAEMNRLKKVRWILYAGIICIGVVLNMIYKIINFKQDGWYYLTLSLLPLVFYVFAWLYGDKAAWREDTHEDIIWRLTHFTVFWPLQLTIVLELQLVYIPILLQMHCIEGMASMVKVGIIIFIVLVVISAFRVGWKKKNIVDYFWNGICTFIITIGITCAVFLATCSVTEYGVAEVKQTSVLQAKFSVIYYATIVLDDDLQVSLRISKTVYDSIEQGEDVIVCRKEGILDTEFIEIQTEE